VVFLLSQTGSGTVVGDGARIVRSVVGRDVVIGEGAVLTDCYVWDGATIGDKVSVATFLCD
jgi:NDP-sugar pyrophosphorylase family protein